MENFYNGIESIKKLNNIYYIKLLIDFIEPINLISSKNYNTKRFRDVNWYSYSKKTIIIYNKNLKADEINAISKEILTNYIINRYFNSNEKTINNVFSELNNKEFTYDIVDGMEIARNYVENVSVINDLIHRSILFLIVKTDTANYKNYHYTINDIIRSRFFKGLPTYLFFNGTEKEAKERDYYFTTPIVFNIDKDNTNKEITKKNSKNNKIKIEDILID